MRSPSRNSSFANEPKSCLEIQEQMSPKISRRVADSAAIDLTIISFFTRATVLSREFALNLVLEHLYYYSNLMMMIIILIRTNLYKEHTIMLIIMYKRTLTVHE